MEVNEFLEGLKKDVSDTKKDLEKLKFEIDRAKAIGLDTRELNTRYSDLTKQIELIEKVYKI